MYIYFKIRGKIMEFLSANKLFVNFMDDDIKYLISAKIINC